MKSFMNELSITYYGNLRSYVEMFENVFFYKYVDYEILLNVSPFQISIICRFMICNTIYVFIIPYIC